MVPIYEQIIDQIKTMIRKGDLKQNDQLPSVRALSKELKISVLTVKKAYDELEREGFTVTVHGKGSYVTAANTELIMEEQRKEVEQDLEQAIFLPFQLKYEGEIRKSNSHQQSLIPTAYQ